MKDKNFYEGLLNMSDYVINTYYDKNNNCFVGVYDFDEDKRDSLIKTPCIDEFYDLVLKNFWIMQYIRDPEFVRDFSGIRDFIDHAKLSGFYKYLMETDLKGIYDKAYEATIIEILDEWAERNNLDIDWDAVEVDS